MRLVPSLVLLAPLVIAGCGGSDDAAPAGAAGSGTAGSGTAGSGTAGSGTAGSATAGAGAGGASGTAGSGGTALPPDTKESLLAKLALPCSDSLDTFYDAFPAPVTWSASDRGSITRCAYEKALTAAEIDAFMTGIGGPTGATTDVHKLRLAYFTEGIDGKPVPTTATLLVPAIRKGASAPLVVHGHGTVGIADACAPSKDPMGGGSDNDWRAVSWGVSSRGLTVMMPDYPGLGLPGSHAWMFSGAEGRALLDGTRAARKLVKPGFFSDKNAVLGHSQGGHAALSAQALATTYGSAGSIDTFVVFAPFWMSNAAWGAVAHPIGEVIAPPAALNFALVYFYGHLEAYEGAGHGVDAFQPAKAAMVKDILETKCLADLTPSLQAIGVMKSSNVFTDPYRNIVGGCGLSGTCSDPLAKTWLDRWVADRPVLDAARPVVLWQGGKDDTVAPGRAQCGVDRIKAESVPLTLCGDADAGHGSILTNALPWTMQHLGEKLLGEAAAPACPAIPDLGACSTPPANGTAAGDP